MFWNSLIQAWTILLWVFSWWWIVLPIIFVRTAWHLWLLYIRTKYIAGLKWTLLEIRIPKEVLRTPKAMEQIFSGLHGSHGAGNKIDQYIKGKVAGWISCEIVSLGGQTHFFVRLPEALRNLLESQVYGQYPKAEIFPVEDYVTSVPADAPNEEWDVWGTDLMLTKPDAYPIRTYEYFFGREGSVKEEYHLDPLASLMEVLGNLQPGENLWLQVLIQTAGDKWKKDGEELIAKIAGKKPKSKEPTLLQEVQGMFTGIGSVLSGQGAAPKKPEKEAPLSTVTMLTPGEREVLAAVEQNISKLGFSAKVRIVYTAPRKVFNRGNVAAVMGVFRQFNTQHMNGFRPNKITAASVDYFFKKQREFIRKKKIFINYRRRWLAEKPNSLNPKGLFVLNTEELATIYHFPGVATVAPALPRIESKRSEPPPALPVL